MKFSRFPLVVGLSLPVLFVSPSVIAEEAATDLGEVVVTADRTARSVDDTLASVSIITRDDIEKSHSKDVVELLRKNTLGLDFTVSGGAGKASSLHMRGTESDHVLVLIDGVRAGSATLGQMAWQFLTADMIERIEVVRGSRSSLYGADAIGGIVSITTRKGKLDSSHISLSAGSFDTQKISVGTSQGSENTRYSINASYIDTDGIDARVTNNPDKDGYENTSLNFNVAHKVSDRTDISLNAFHAEGDTEYDDFGDDNRSSYSDFSQQNLVFQVGSDLSENWNTNLNIGEYRDESESFDGFPGEFNTKRQQVNWQSDVSLSNNSDLVFGVDYQIDKVSGTTAYVEDSRDNTGYFGQYFTDFAGNDIQFSLRLDDNEAYGVHKTGGLAVGRSFGNARLTTSYGTAFKAPTFNELYFPNFGNTNLDPEESQQFEIGLRYEMASGYLNANVFRNNVKNLIGAVLIDPNLFTFQAKNINKARIDGLELELKKDFNKLRTNTNLTFLNPVDITTGKVLESRVKQTLKVNVDQDIGNITLGGTLLAQSKRAGGAFSNEIVGYTTADLRLSHRINKRLTLKAEVNNLLDKEYQTKDGFDMPDRNVMFTVSYQ